MNLGPGRAGTNAGLYSGLGEEAQEALPVRAHIPTLFVGPPVMPAGFGTVAAGGHVAPATAAVPAVVEEEPLAIGRLAQAHDVQIVGSKQVGRGLRHWPDKQLQGAGGGAPAPGITAVLGPKRTMPQRRSGLLAGYPKVGGAGPATLREGGKHSIDRLAQRNGRRESAARFEGMALGVGAKLLGLLLPHNLGLARERNKVQAVRQVIVSPFGIVATAHRVGKVKGQLPARKIELKLRLPKF